MPLTHDQQRRYARHLLLPEIGLAGQERLAESKVLMIGAGGLGASALSYLAACGTGTIGIVDDDTIELSNLNRQIIHETGDIGRAKVASAMDRLSELNPDCRIIPYQQRLDTKLADSLFPEYDIIIDGTDNFATRFIINDMALYYKLPWIYAAVRGFDAQISCFVPKMDAPCYRCFIPAEPHGRNDCAERGILGALVGVIGSMMTIEAVKLLLNIGQSYTGRLLRYQALSGSWKESRLVKDPDCLSCKHIVNKTVPLE